MPAEACAMTMENMWVIASEKPDFDKEEFINWLEEHIEGYFLRDPESVLDCKYFEPRFPHPDPLLHPTTTFPISDRV